MITIISPAKTLDFSTHIQTKKFSQADFLEESKILMNELRKLNLKDIAALMKVNPEIANLNFERNLSWRIPFNADNAKQALLAFKGQVYIGLEAKSLNENELIFALTPLASTSLKSPLT